MLHRLQRMVLKKKWFHTWRHYKGDAEIWTVPLEDLVWTEQDMDEFLRTEEPFDTHQRLWKQEREDRKHREHKHYGKVMPPMTPPSFVRLFQLGLAQVHSRKFMQHFGILWDIDSVLHTPIQVIAEQQKVAASAAMATPFPDVSVQGGHEEGARQDDLRFGLT